jgi:hypothetical protein
MHAARTIGHAHLSIRPSVMHVYMHTYVHTHTHTFTHAPQNSSSSGAGAESIATSATPASSSAAVLEATSSRVALPSKMLQACSPPSQGTPAERPHLRPLVHRTTATLALFTCGPCPRSTPWREGQATCTTNHQPPCSHPSPPRCMPSWMDCAASVLLEDA